MAKKVGTPDRAPFLKEMLERYVFDSEERFEAWVTENFTEAVKELGKLQPKNVTVGGDNENPLITEIVIKHVKTGS